MNEVSTSSQACSPDTFVRPGALTFDTLGPVLVTNVSSDSHTWNLVFMQLYLEHRGFEVINLGACMPDELIQEAIRRHRPGLVVVSTVNGHGHIDGARLIGKIRAAEDLATVKIVIGGKLGVEGIGNARHVEALVAAGFDAAFDDAGDIQRFDRYVRELTIGAEAATSVPAGLSIQRDVARRTSRRPSAAFRTEECAV